MMINHQHCRFLSQSDIAFQIERLVQAIEGSETLAFRVPDTPSNYGCAENTELSRYFTNIRHMVDLFEGRIDYSYSEQLQAFREACQDIGLERDPFGPVCKNEQGTAYLDHHRSMNVLVARIRQLTRERWYLRGKYDKRHQAKVQERAVCDYADALRELYSRTTIVRVNFYYHSKAQARLQVEHVFDDLDELINKHKRNVIFDHLIGHIYSVEQGGRNDGKGFHIHAAYFFNGNEVQRDVYKAIQLGELWEDITHGRGYAHSCNHDKEKYGDECGIGRILRSDRAVRPHVHKAVKYLVKDDQHLRLRPKGARSLRMGLVRLSRRRD
jgi:hypothetical protein